MTRLLYLTSPLMHGRDVHQVQLDLRAHGFSPGPIDGVYGAATAAAVRDFQRRWWQAGSYLMVDGIVGTATFRALEAEQAPSAPPAHMGREPAGVEALAWMRARLGLTESPPDSNRCPITEEFRLVGPWCMMTVSLAFKHGAGIILGDHVTNGRDVWGYWPDRGFAYVPAFEAWAKTCGYDRGRGTPTIGDVVTYSFGGREAVHVGIVERYIGGGQFDAIEGNTGLGNDANGGEIMRRRRYVSQLHGVYRVTRTIP